MSDVESPPQPPIPPTAPRRWLVSLAVAVLAVGLGVYVAWPFFQSDTQDSEQEEAETSPPPPAPPAAAPPVAAPPAAAPPAAASPSAPSVGPPTAPLPATARATPPQPVATASVPPATTTPATTTPAPATPAPATARPALAPPAPARAEATKPGVAAPEAPSFDIVRVDAQGYAVMAGRGPANADLAIRDGGRELGHVRADPDGQWAFTPATPLAPGGHTLSLVAGTPGGGEIRGAATVMVAVAERGPGEKPPAGPLVVMAPEAPIAAPPGSPQTAPTSATASGTPALPGAGLRVLQVPELKEGASKEAKSSQTSADTEHTPVELQVVEYDDSGAIRFGGHALHGAPVRLYVDNQLAGDTETDSQGAWMLTPRVAVPAGPHQLRVDELDSQGRVLARVEVPFQREALKPAPTLAPGQVIVQPGENLWKLAYRVYGTGARYAVIYRANRSHIRDPRRIYPGQVLTVPPAARPHSSNKSR